MTTTQYFGKCIIFSAPSGAGKTTIVQHLLGKFPELAFSISACSREPRPNETHGKHYYFLGIEGFKESNLNDLIDAFFLRKHPFFQYKK